MKDLIGTVINSQSAGLQYGYFVCVDKRGLYVRMLNKWMKYRWYHKLIGLKPRHFDTVLGIDTSKFKKGDDLYVSHDKPGCFTTKRH